MGWGAHDGTYDRAAQAASQGYAGQQRGSRTGGAWRRSHRDPGAPCRSPRDGNFLANAAMGTGLAMATMSIAGTMC